MSQLDTDVLIIGSGFGAAPPAVRLAEAGFRVVVLEKGPDIDAPSTFEQTQDPAYFLRYYHHLAGERLGMTYIEGLGGGSGFYEMISLRAPSMAFQQRDGGRSVWPDSVDRAALDPHYEVAERMLNVHQIPVDEVPRSGLVFSRMMKNLGYTCDRAAYAVRGCLGSGFCVSGCIYGAKQSLHFNYIPRARAAGAEYRTGTTAIRIRSIGASASVSDLRSDIPRYEVVCRDGSGRRHVHRARIVVVAGGTVGSARLLMASRAELPGLSEAIGRRVAFNGGVKTAGFLGPGWPEGDMFTGRSHPGMISYEFLESHGVTVQAAKPLPLQAIAAARLRIPDSSSPARRFWGTDHMALMKAYRRRVIVLFALGLTPPTARLELRHGELQLRLDVTDELRAYHRRTKALLTSIYEDNGCRALDVDFVDSNGMPRPDVSFSTAHQLGSCPMSDSPAHGVVDAAGEAHRLPGLFVTGGAALPGSIAVSTSLTILANAERVSERLVHRLTRRPRVVLAEGV